jgi:hypothetical protein
MHNANMKSAEKNIISFDGDVRISKRNFLGHTRILHNILELLF